MIGINRKENEIKIKKKQIQMMGIVFWLLIAFLFIMLFSVSTSFLYKPYGVDSYIFMGIGKGILKGKLPYRDLTENKGPVFFLIQMIGQIMGKGKKGAFCLQIWFLLADFSLIKKLYSSLELKRYWLGIVMFLLQLFLTYAPGNSVEEYIVTFILAQTCILVRLVTKQHQKNYLLYIGMGTITACVALIRLNDIFAILFMDLLACFAVQKKWKDRSMACLAVMGGQGFIFGIIYLWLKRLGIVTDMIKRYILINFRYLSQKGESSLAEAVKLRANMLIHSSNAHVGEVLIILIFLLCSILCFLLKKRQKEIRWKYFLGIAGILISLFLQIFVSTSNYGHYAIVLTPMAILVAILIEQIGVYVDKQIYIGGVCVCILLLLVRAYRGTNFYYIFGGLAKEQSEQGYSHMKEVAEYIGEGEVYGYGIEPSFYYVIDKDPGYREYLLNSFLTLDPEGIGSDFSKYMGENPPEYFVFRKNSQRELFARLGEGIQEVFENSYKKIFENEWASLYQYSDK